MVFLTNSPVPHYTIFSQAVEENWYVYEVEPLTKVEPGSYEEIVTRQARIIKCVGRARSLGRNPKRQFSQFCLPLWASYHQKEVT